MSLHAGIMSGFKRQMLKIKNNPLIQWLMVFAGWTLIYAYAQVTPISFEPVWIFYYFAVYCGIVLICFLLHYTALHIHSKITQKTDSLDELLNPLFNPECKAIQPYKLSSPWKFILLCPAEDGLFLLPLLYFGIDATTASISAALFALAHYPSYTFPACASKGLGYFGVAMLVLPNSGIAPIIVAHVALDILGFSLLNSLGPLHPYKFYFEDGTLHEEGFTKNALREGMVKQYHPNGQIYSEAFYRKNVPNGNIRVFSENGVLIGEGLKKNNKWHGPYRKYHENGNLAVEGIFKNGQWNGLVKGFKEDGTFDYETHYKNGKVLM